MSRYSLFLSMAFVISSGLPVVAMAQQSPAPATTPKAVPVAKGMGLQDVLRHVYQQDPGLQAARQGLHAAHEMYPQALAGRRPTLSAQTSIYTTNIESGNFTRGDGATTKDMSVNLEQPVYTSGRTDAQVDKANNMIKASYASFLQDEQDLLFETAQAYMNVVRDRELLHLSQKNEDILGTELKAVQERFTGGDVTRTDVEQTSARLARAQADRIAAWSNLENSYAGFQEITGFMPFGTFYYPVPAFAFPSTLEEMVRIASEKNQQLQMARYQLAASQDEIDYTLRELLPTITAFASYDKQYDPQPGIVDESETQTLGLRATISLYRGGAERSRIREAKSRSKQRHYQVLEAEQDVRANILRNWKTLKMAEEEMVSRKTETDSASQAREGVKEEARMGERTVLDVLDADQEVLAAESSRIRARYDAIIASFSLARSLGIFSPEGIGLGDIAYDPGDHYRAAGDKIFSFNDE